MYFQKYLLHEEKKFLESGSLLKPIKNGPALKNIDKNKTCLPDTSKQHLPDNLDVKVTGLTASWTKVSGEWKVKIQF